jgi:adenine phosphoribosyltransferase
MINFKEHIVDVPDFPKKGVIFRDITPLLASPRIFNKTMDELSLLLGEHFDEEVKLLAGIEARGFLIGAAMASLNGHGFIPIRKEGKLPPPKVATYSTKEYGVDMLEVKESSVFQDIILVDDVLATGGTLKASEKLLNSAGYNVVGAITLIDLTYLHSEDILIGGKKVISLIQY